MARVNQTEVKRWPMVADPKQLGEQLRKFFARATIYPAYEAG
ncbi:MAG: hypothetical protein ACP5RH_05195 [Leptodesmis sp.]